MGRVMSLGEVFDYAAETKIDSDRFRTMTWELRDSLTRFANSRSVMGTIEDSVAMLMHDQHIPLLMGLENAYWMQGVKARELMHNFMTYMNENNEEAVFRYEEIKALENRVISQNDRFLDLSDDIRLLYESINDDMRTPLAMPNNFHYENHYTSARRTLAETLTRIESFSFDFTEIESLIEEIEGFVHRIKSLDDFWMPGPQGMGRYAGLGAIPTAERLAIMNASNSGSFPQEMADMNRGFLAVEIANLDRLAASLRGVAPENMTFLLPNPPTLNEMHVFYQALGEIHSYLEKCALLYTMGALIESTASSGATTIINDFPRFEGDFKWWLYGFSFFNDVVIQGGSVGQATVYYGGSIGVGLGMKGLLSLVSWGKGPIGWAIAVVTAGAYSTAYGTNFLGFKDGVHWVGDRIDLGIESIGDFFRATPEQDTFMYEWNNHLQNITWEVCIIDSVYPIQLGGGE